MVAAKDVIAQVGDLQEVQERVLALPRHLTGAARHAVHKVCRPLVPLPRSVNDSSNTSGSVNDSVTPCNSVHCTCT